MLKKAYEPAQYEDTIYSEWEKSGGFTPVENDKKPFVISMPPPNATGTLHLGHATFLTIQDIFIRYNRMMGRPTLWLPGTDHAAIATQSVVEKKLQSEGIAHPREELGREKLLEEIADFTEACKDRIREQIRKMGASCDWDREKYTLDTDLHHAVNTFFQSMHEDGIIYRGGRIVNWDPHMQTTVADDEVEYIEKKSKFYYFQYGPVVIGTARPETKFLDKIIVVHPDDERYTHLHGKEFELEWIEGTIKARVITDECIDMEMGTGAMTITPAHSMVDFEMAEKYGLSAPQIIDFDGKIREDVSEEFGGMPILEAREKIVEKLEKKGLLVKIDEQYVNKVAVNYRGKGMIEPQIMKQWFIDVNRKVIHWKGQERSIKEVLHDVVETDMVEIIPERFEKVYFHWIDNLRDWCISRQIWWGHRIPVWYKVSKEQYDAFYEKKDASSVMLEVIGVDGEIRFGAEKPDGEYWIQDPDTLDTWFSSALWTFSTLGWPEKTEDLLKFHPTSVLETGYDILFFWVARMILASTYCLRKTGFSEEESIPFKKVYLHGLVRDRQGRKMSKSHPETCIDPLDMIEKYGADALRLSLVIGSTPGNDMRLYEEKIAGYRNYVNKVWNVARFVDMKLNDQGIERYATQKDLEDAFLNTDLHAADVVMLQQLHDLINASEEAISNYNVAYPGEYAYEFLWNEFADWYIEISKVEPNFVVMQYAINVLLRMMHPYMPYVTEALWKEFGFEGVLMNVDWPDKAVIKQTLQSCEDIEGLLQKYRFVQELVTGVRRIRADYTIPFSTSLNILVDGSEKELHKRLEASQLEWVQSLANISEIKPDASPDSKCIHLHIKGIDFYVPLGELVDFDEELKRIDEELKRLHSWIETIEKKLLNKQFVDNAPSEIVEKEQMKLVDAKEKQEALQSRRAELNS